MNNLNKNAIELIFKISNLIENEFNTTILRKMYCSKSNFMFNTIKPINIEFDHENKLTTNFEFLKKYDNPNVNVLCVLLIPIDNNCLIDNNLNVTDSNKKNVLIFLEKNGYLTYDGGNLKMSYLISEGINIDGLYSTEDTPINIDIYEKLGAVVYQRIIFYI